VRSPPAAADRAGERTRARGELRGELYTGPMITATKARRDPFRLLDAVEQGEEVVTLQAHLAKSNVLPL